MALCVRKDLTNRLRLLWLLLFSALALAEQFGDLGRRKQWLQQDERDESGGPKWSHSLEPQETPLPSAGSTPLPEFLGARRVRPTVGPPLTQDGVN